MTTLPFNIHTAHPSWQDCLQQGLAQIDPTYLQQLAYSTSWLPGPDKIFNAFSLPLNNVNYVLFGESPYPRAASANGYAFWDASVDDLWSPSGLSKPVNRATSLRNMIKMLLIAEGLIDPHDASQTAIAHLDKTSLVKTNDAFFSRLLQKGFLLLNATPVLQAGSPQKDARAWHPFVQNLLDCLLEKRPTITLILFGRIAHTLESFIQHHPHVKTLRAEHPYNISFITNQTVIEFFQPLHLLLD